MRAKRRVGEVVALTRQGANTKGIRGVVIAVRVDPPHKIQKTRRIIRCQQRRRRRAATRAARRNQQRRRRDGPRECDGVCSV